MVKKKLLGLGKQIINYYSNKEDILESNSDNISEERDNVEAHNNISNEDKYNDGDKFEKSLYRDLDSISINPVNINIIDAFDVVNKLVDMMEEVSKFTEVQITRRKEIEAQRDVIITQINNQKEIILLYLDKTFDERRCNFERLFLVVDNAIEKNNMDQLSIGLDSINRLADSSPFKSLTDLHETQKALTDKGHVWNI